MATKLKAGIIGLGILGRQYIDLHATPPSKWRLCAMSVAVADEA